MYVGRNVTLFLSGIQGLEIIAAIHCLTRLPSAFCQPEGMFHTFAYVNAYVNAHVLMLRNSPSNYP